MEKREACCCFTGHRPSKLPWGFDEKDPRCRELKTRLSDTVRSVYGSGCSHFISGMAAGCDMYFCEAVLELREERPDVTLEAAIPCEGQSGSWPEDIRLRYSRLVSECDSFRLIQKEYTPDCMMRRNRYMVDCSSVLIAVYNGSAGGTRSTMLYAMREGLRIIELPVEARQA